MTYHTQRIPILVLLILGLTGPLGLVGCSRSSRSSETLVLTGSSTVAPLVQEMGRRFEELHPGVRVNVQAGGSSRGVLDARRGLADLGMASRSLHADEQDLSAITIARDGVGIIVHRDNPVSDLNDDQIRAIYRGETRDWRSVGGRPGPIVVVHKAAGHSTLELFLKYFGLDSSEVRADMIIGDNQQGIKAVASNPQAIGYVSIGGAETEIAHGATLRLLPLGGVAATTAHVRDGSFPLARPLNLVQHGELSELAREFLRFAQSAEVRGLIEGQFFVAP